MLKKSQNWSEKTDADREDPHINPLKGGIAGGLGTEYAFTNNWSAKLEYMFIGQLNGASTQNANMICVGVNFDLADDIRVRVRTTKARASIDALVV